MRNKHSDSQQWVLEWSRKSNNLHILPLASLLGINSSRFVLDAAAPGDYIPIAIGTREEVNKRADAHRETVIARDHQRGHGREVSHG